MQIISSKKKQKKIFKNLLVISSALILGLTIDLMRPSYANIFDRLGPKRFLIEGNKSLEKKNFNDAIKFYDDAIKFLPNEGEPYYKRGLAKYRLGLYESSLKDFEEAIKIDPKYKNDYKFLEKIAGNYWYIENYDKAIYFYNLLIELKPNYAQAYFWRGKSYLVLGDYENSINDFNSAIKIFPTAEDYYWRARAYELLFNFDLAIDSYDQAINLEPKESSYILSRGVSKAKKGLEKEALIDYQTALTLSGDNAVILNNICASQERLEEYEKAYENCSKSIKLNPFYGSAYLNRAKVNFFKDNFSEAISDLNNAEKYSDKFNNEDILFRAQLKFFNNDYQGAYEDFLKVENIPENEFYGWYLKSRAQTLFLLNKFAEAIKDFEKYIEVVEENAESYFYISRSKNSLGDYEGALIAINKAIKIVPNNDDYLFQKGLIYEDLEDYKKAFSYINKAIEINPNDYFKFYRQGFAYGSNDQYDLALIAMNKSISLNDKYVPALIERAYINSKLGDIQGEKEDYLKVLEIDPQNSDALNDLGVIYYNSGELLNALEYYKRAYKSDPDSIVTIVNLGDVLIDLDKTEEGCEYYKKAATLGDDEAKALVQEKCN